MKFQTFILVITLLCLLMEISEISAWRRRRRRRCPVTNCQVTWRAWSGCSPTCGSKRVQTRTGTVVRYPSCGGAACPPLTQTRDCTGNGNCRNGGTPIPGRCRCKPGFTGTCCQSDINECSSTSRCAHICVNTHGSYYCKCKPGYKLATDRRSCLDINECLIKPSKCHQLCSNTVGSYRCYCKTGYKMGSKGRTCEDINECANGQSKCEHVCVNNQSNYSCQCNQGYQLGADGYSCHDINECTNGQSKCDHVCVNNQGNYSCQCNQGYELGADGYSCHDIDECSSQPSKCHQLCVNTQGNYTCQCKTGYKFETDGWTCVVDAKCVVNFIGCYRDYYSSVLNITLISARDKRSDVYYGETINWKNYDVWLPKFVCDCAEKTKYAGFNVFSIQYYGLCMTGGGDYTLPGSSASCADSHYQTCKSGSKWCTGKGRMNAVYKIVP